MGIGPGSQPTPLLHPARFGDWRQVAATPSSSATEQTAGAAEPSPQSADRPVPPPLGDADAPGDADALGDADAAGGAVGDAEALLGGKGGVGEAWASAEAVGPAAAADDESIVEAALASLTTTGDVIGAMEEPPVGAAADDAAELAASGGEAWLATTDGVAPTELPPMSSALSMGDMAVPGGSPSAGTTGSPGDVLDKFQVVIMAYNIVMADIVMAYTRQAPGRYGLYSYGLYSYVFTRQVPASYGL